MKWKQYKDQKFNDDKIYLICYVNSIGIKKYDKMTSSNGDPYIVGRNFAFDVVKEIHAFIEIEEYND